MSALQKGPKLRRGAPSILRARAKQGRAFDLHADRLCAGAVLAELKCRIGWVHRDHLHAGKVGGQAAAKRNIKGQGQKIWHAPEGCSLGHGGDKLQKNVKGMIGLCRAFVVVRIYGIS